jgi:Cd2+/Zn2+-exporting ATPase
MFRNMEKEQKHILSRIIIAAVLLVAAVLVEKFTSLKTWQLLLVYLVPYFIVGWDTLREAGEKIFKGELLDEDFLMSLATVGALAIGFLPDTPNQFPEAVVVMLFFQIGELFESIAEGKSRKSISDLMDIRPDTAFVERGGEVLTVNPSEVSVGETIVIKPGGKVPLDGVVIEGSSSLNTVALTGESMPRDVSVGDPVISGCVNQGGLLRARVTKAFGESTASKIIDLVENASSNKSRSENFITKFARVYTPVVVAAAILLAVLPPLFSSAGFMSAFPTWLYRTLIFLIVSCPCALVISVPLSFFGGIGGASRNGILVKGSNYLEALSKLDTVVFDKTGTLTKGVFEVNAVHPLSSQKFACCSASKTSYPSESQSVSNTSSSVAATCAHTEADDSQSDILAEKKLLHLAAHVESFSTHPIAISLRNAYPNTDDGCTVENVEEIAGRGVRALVNGHEVCVGNSKMMDDAGAAWKHCDATGTIIHVCMDGEYLGHIVISDVIKDDAKAAISALKALGVRRTVMLTGDKNEVGEYVASQVGVDEYHAEMLPADKVSKVEQLLAEKPSGRVLAFVGDGINDAPVLARADVGIAMGGLGSDAAIEAADVVLMDDKPSKIATGIRIARRTLRIANENTWFAIGIKLLVLVLAAFGLATLWMSVFADVGVTVLAVLNSLRTLR